MSERDIFLAALEINRPAERSAWLVQQCGADCELRQRIEGLLLAHAAAGEFLEQPAREIPTTPDRP